MASIFTPCNQIKLTNVSVVRLKKGGKRFELACYKNKLTDYRDKKTKDLEQVLQTWTVFSNVSKGEVSKKEDILKAFGTADTKKVVQEVSTKEREAHTDSLLKDISVMISERCLNPETGRPYTPSMIEKAIQDLHISIKLEQSAKQQALEVLKQLEKNRQFPIIRTQMKIKVHVPKGVEFKVRDEIILENGAQTSTKILKREYVGASGGEGAREIGQAEDVVFEVLVDPGKYKIIHDKVAQVTKGEGTVFLMNAKD